MAGGPTISILQTFKYMHNFVPVNSPIKINGNTHKCNINHIPYNLKNQGLTHYLIIDLQKYGVKELGTGILRMSEFRRLIFDFHFFSMYVLNSRPPTQLQGTLPEASFLSKCTCHNSNSTSHCHCYCYICQENFQKKIKIELKSLFIQTKCEQILQLSFQMQIKNNK